MSYSAKTYVGGATPATLVADISSTATSFDINIPSTYTTPWTTLAAGVSTAPGVLVLDYGQSSEEKVLISGLTIVGGVGTVTVSSRGYDGTPAQAHYAASAYSVIPVAAAVDFQEANDAVVRTIGKITSAGDMLYGTGANTTNRLAIGSQGGILTSTGSAPSWLAVGGAGTILQGGTTPSWLAAGTSGYKLESTGSGVQWASQVPPTLSAYRASGTPSLSANTWTAAPLDTTNFTTGSSAPTCDYTTNKGRFTINKAGVYRVSGAVTVAGASSIAYVQAKIVAGTSIASGVVYIGNKAVADSVLGGSAIASADISCASGDKIELQALCNVGTTFASGANPLYTYCSVTYLGPSA